MLRNLLDDYGVPRWLLLVVSVAACLGVFVLLGTVGAATKAATAGPPVFQGSTPGQSPSTALENAALDNPTLDNTARDNTAVDKSVVAESSTTIPPRPPTAVAARTGATAFTGSGASTIRFDEAVPVDLGVIDVATGPGGTVNVLDDVGEVMDGGSWSHSGSGFKSGSIVVANVSDIALIQVLADGPWSVTFRPVRVGAADS